MNCLPGTAIPVYFHYFANEQCKGSVVSLLRRMAGFLPHWVQQVNVCSYQRAGGDGVCSIRLLPEYRKIEIGVYETFWDVVPEKQLEYLCHEVCHAITGYFAQWVQDNLLGFIKENHADVHPVFAKEFENRFESITEELNGIFLRVLGTQGPITTGGNGSGSREFVLNQDQIPHLGSE